MEISEKEFAVIREISNNHLPDQRTIASRTGFSLGLTNMIIKRMISKGYIKAKQLNQKKIQYLLTPKGFAEKANKSYTFTLKTINLIKTIKEGILLLVEQSDRDGFREFVISGNSDLADITEIVFRSITSAGVRFRRINNGDISEGGARLTMRNDETKAVKDIDLILYLSENGLNYWK